MTVFTAMSLILVSVSYVFKTVDTNYVNHEVIEKIFDVIDDLFISLKIKQKLVQNKHVDRYNAMHNFVQDAQRKSREKYKEIHDNIKISISNKMADQISGVNEIIDEMIREKSLQNETYNNENNVFVNFENFNDLTYLAKGLNIETKTNALNDLTLLGSNASHDVEGRRIFAGTSTGIERYPFMVSVHVMGRFVCAGSLLHESLAISAASCLIRLQDDTSLVIQMRTGSDYVTKDGSLVNIDRAFFHPEFDRATLANNLVLLKTKKALRFQKKKVVAIKYDRWDNNLSPLKDIKDVLILGWGRRSKHDQKDVERPLSRARLNIYDLEECKYIYTREYVTDKNFCAGYVDRGDGACNHDGGGPALAGSLLTGVISFGSPHCGHVDAPTVFTQLGLYGDWIERVMDSVKITKGAHANPFQFPGSFELGVPSEELEKVEIELGHPREVLEREFGLKDIINGPIDVSTSATINPSIVETQNFGNNKDTRAKVTEDVHAEIQQIEFSDDSEEPTTFTPGDETTLLQVKEKEGAHFGNDDFTNFIKRIFANSKIIANKVESDTISTENDFLEHVDVISDPISTTSASSADGEVMSRERVEVTDVLPITQIYEWKNFNDKPIDNSNLVEAFELEYQIDMLPPSVRKIKSRSGNNKTFIVVSNSETTQRIEVNNTNKLGSKIMTGIKNLLESLLAMT